MRRFCRGENVGSRGSSCWVGVRKLWLGDVEVDMASGRARRRCQCESQLVVVVVAGSAWFQSHRPDEELKQDSDSDLVSIG